MYEGDNPFGQLSVVTFVHAGLGLAFTLSRRGRPQGYAPSPMGIISVDSCLQFAIQ